MLPFPELIETLKNLRFPDAEFFKRGALAPLASNFDAYPVTNKGRKLCILVPIGLKPAAVSQMDETQLSARVVVLANDAGKWAKVWPGKAPPAPAPAAPAPKAEATKSETDDLSIEFVEE